MTPFDKLLSSAGTWEGTNQLQFATGEPMQESPNRIVSTPLLHNTFLRIDQTWTWKNELQHGSILIGYNPKTETATLHWIDTFHNGVRVMTCTGNFTPKNTLIVLGSYPAPNSPDWGWRIEIPTPTENHFQIDMFNLNPNGQQDGGVWAKFYRE
jgi:hypothetical protein